MFSLTCKECWKIYENAYSGSKYCSKECYANSRKKHSYYFCEVCWEKFYPTNLWQKYCSRECYDKIRIKDRICKVCWKHFKPRKESIYCSRECYHADVWTHKDIKCWYCWKLFHQTTNIQMYCSTQCFTKARIYLEDIRCKECWKLFHPRTWVTAYCSNECKNKSEDRLNKIIETNIERHWVPYCCMTKECTPRKISKTNLDFNELLNNKHFSTSLEFNIWWRSYDIKVWNTLIEINPFSYHNSTWHPKWKEPISYNYHYEKLKLARDNWYRCIMVWDWDDIEKVTYLLDDNKETIYARKCELKQITRDDCHEFFETYHLQWDIQKNKNNIYIWLYYNNELVECMSFWKPRYNKNYEREILRLCSHKDYKVVWWANRIFNKFIETTWTDSVISYCDMSKFDWKVYENLWFKLLKWNKPSKHWYNPKEIESRQHITDNFLRQRWYDQIFNENFGKWTDNNELMIQRGYVEIYDCWQSTFVWQAN